LLAEGAQVIAVERDQRCLAALAEIAEQYPGRLTVIEGDALRIAPSDLPLPATGQKLSIVANLPYNIGTALLTLWLESEPWPPWFDRLTLMFQREVAERIVATPQERADYGRLAVLCNWRTETKILFDIGSSAFVPPPKVVSSVVELVPRPEPLACSTIALARVTQAAFGQRRKMLRQSLRALSAGGKPIDVPGLLASVGIDGRQRAENLGIADFVSLARALQSGLT
jgi:16S rRNA (adenine1518-N6/adenine1519-N6)-dimethyltransferase